MCLSAFPSALTSCSISRMHALSALMTNLPLSKAPCFECGQLFPLAVLLSSYFHTPHAAFDTACTPQFFYTHTFASAVHKEMYQSPPEAISFAVAMLWTCFLTISLFLLDSILPEGGSPYSMYMVLAHTFPADLDPTSISCPIPARS
jgi:hypothetical protein